MKIRKSTLPQFVKDFLIKMNWKGRKFYYQEALTIDLFRLFDYQAETYYGFDSNGQCTGKVSSMTNDSAAGSKFGMRFHSSNKEDTTLPIPAKCYIVKVIRGYHSDSISIYHNPNTQNLLEVKENNNYDNNSITTLT